MLLRLVISAVILVLQLTTNLYASHNSPEDDGGGKLILILHSYHPGLGSTDAAMAGIQEALLQAPVPPNFQVEYMDTKRHPDSEYFNHVLDAILHYKLQDRSFDLLIVTGNEALNFALDHRFDLFINTPIIFAAVESFPKERLTGETNLTGVIQQPDYLGLLEQATRLHPNARRGIFIGHTNGFSDKLVDEKIQQVVANFKGLEFEFWTNCDHDDMPQRLDQLDENDLLFINGLYTDTNGNLPCILTRESLKAPLYSPLEVYFGKGTIGGPLTNDKQQGTIAGEMALQVLSGENIDDIPIVSPQPEAPRFDNLQLLRHGISSSLLPPGARLINMPQSTYPLSKNLFYAILALLATSVGITFFLSTNHLKRIKAERLYKQLSQQFQIILTGIPDNLTLISPDMRVIWSNKGGGELVNKQLGTEPGEFCCKHLYNSSALCENCPAVDAIASGKNEEATIISPDGQVLEVKAFPIKDQQDKVTSAILLASDITEKNRLRDEAIRASRLASLGELAAGVAHEINNPNALIKLNAELLQKSFDGALPILQEYYQQHGDFALGGLNYTEIQEELPYLFKEMLDGTERIKHIVNDLKDFSRNDSPTHNDTIDLNELVQTSVRLLKNTIKNSTDHFSTDFTDAIPKFKGSFQRIEQVVVNLLVNACQALPAKDKAIWVKTDYDSLKQRIKLQISDEGVGIASEDLEHITEPFFTTKRKEGGTGLGLSVATRIVEDHGGKLSFHSQPSQGTTVTLLLPASRPGASND
jgi:signal transduction histidine kinase/ABC-type uncharacterized transport system substrate-binding protein